MIEFLFFFIGLLVGVFLTTKLLVKEPIGTLKVDHSDPDSTPYLFLELDNGKAHKIQEEKHIMLRVDISQK